jgi:hypothetical protein
MDAGTRSPVVRLIRFGLRTVRPYLMDSNIHGGWSKQAMNGRDVTIRVAAPADARVISSLIILLAEEFVFAGPAAESPREEPC